MPVSKNETLKVYILDMHYMHDFCCELCYDGFVLGARAPIFYGPGYPAQKNTPNELKDRRIFQ